MVQPTLALTDFYGLCRSRAYYSNTSIFHKKNIEIKLGTGSEVLFFPNGGYSNQINFTHF